MSANGLLLELGFALCGIGGIRPVDDLTQRHCL